MAYMQQIPLCYYFLKKYKIKDNVRSSQKNIDMIENLYLQSWTFQEMEK